MASFLDRLLGRRPPSPEVADALAQLEAVVAARPTLFPAAAVLRDVLPELFVQTTTAPTSSDSPNPAEDAPLLRGQPVAIDEAALRRGMRAVCAAVAKHQPGDAAMALAAAVKSEAVNPGRLLGDVFAGRPDAVRATADAAGVDAAFTATALRLASLPLLAPRVASLDTSRWEHGFCPGCGSWPLLAEFRGLEQTRVLRCGLCAAGWHFPRLRCPFCGTTDHRQLGYFHAEGEQDRRRAATCDACRGYVKTVTTLSALSPPLLLVTDLATLHLDLVAAQRGYFVG